MSTNLSLKWQAALSALDIVLKAVEQGLPMLIIAPPEDFESGIRNIREAVSCAADYLEELKLSPDALRLRADVEKLNGLTIEHILSAASVDWTAEEIERKKQFYGQFPTPPDEPENSEQFLSHQEAGCTRRAEILTQTVLRIQSVLKEQEAELPTDDAIAAPKAETPTDAADKLKPSEEKAYGQYLWAIKRNAALDGNRDRDVYDWIDENQTDDDEKLPKSSTWQRYLRAGRKYYSDQKNTSRAGRKAGKSVVRQADL